MPGTAGKRTYFRLSKSRIAEYPPCSGERETFQPGSAPIVRKGRRMTDCCNGTHIAVNSNHVWKSGEHRADRAIPFRSLAVHDIWFKLAQLSPNCANTPLVSGSQPPDLRYLKKMKANVFGQLLRRLHRLLRA